MRHPLLDASSQRFTTDARRDGWVRLDIRQLDLLIELAQSTATESRDRIERMQDRAFGPRPDPGQLADLRKQAAYADGVAAALGWVAGHHADDQLTELLSIDEDQR